MVQIGLVLMGVGLVFGILESTFYQYVDQSGVLHESWFLPLAWLFGFAGFAILVIGAVKSRLNSSPS